MKKISAILIACFLCTGATQVSAQEIKELTVVTTPAPYEIAPTDSWVVFTTVRTGSECKLPAPAANKGRVLHIINRRDSKVTISSSSFVYTTAAAGPLTFVLPFSQTVELFCDGQYWIILNKSIF